MVMAKGVPIQNNALLEITPRHYTVMAEEVPNTLIRKITSRYYTIQGTSGSYLCPVAVKAAMELHELTTRFDSQGIGCS